MKILLPLFLFVLIFSCKKNPQNTTCGNPNYPSGKWNIKYEVIGITKPDSVNFRVNNPYTLYGNYYYKNIKNPSAHCLDSTNYCGNTDDDICIEVFDHDSTNTYTLKIYLDNVLKITKTGKTGLNPDYPVRVVWQPFL